MYNQLWSMSSNTGDVLSFSKKEFGKLDHRHHWFKAKVKFLILPTLFLLIWASTQFLCLVIQCLISCANHTNENTAVCHDVSHSTNIYRNLWRISCEISSSGGNAVFCSSVGAVGKYWQMSFIFATHLYRRTTWPVSVLDTWHVKPFSPVIPKWCFVPFCLLMKHDLFCHLVLKRWSFTFRFQVSYDCFIIEKTVKTFAGTLGMYVVHDWTKHRNCAKGFPEVWSKFWGQPLTKDNVWPHDMTTFDQSSALQIWPRYEQIFR